MKTCIQCGILLTGRQQKYCSDACRKRFDRFQENLKNLLPQPQNQPNPDTKPDKLHVSGVDTSGLTSAFPYNDLRDFAAHILALADYEHVWQQRCLKELERIPGPRHINDLPSVDYIRQTMVFEKYRMSEQLLRWIADQVIQAIGGQPVEPHPSPIPAPEWDKIARIRKGQ